MSHFILIRGLIAGFLIAAPVGPIGLICLKRTLARGRWFGLASGLGAATADLFYATLAAFGLSFLGSFLTTHQRWIEGVGGAVLMILGIKLALSKIQPPNSADGPDASDLAKAYISTFFLTLTNPLTILAFTAVFASVGMPEASEHAWSAALFLLAVFTGSSLWWFTLTSFVSFFRAKIDDAWLVRLNHACGALIGLLGFGGILRSVLAI